MANLVFIGGTGHGGRYFDEIAENLRSKGHQVFAPHPSGLDPEVQARQVINLDTHIQDLLDVIEANNLDEVVLVGHSYGGMVITGVADRTKAKVAGLVYLDAALPQPGQRLWDLIDEDMQKGFLASAVDGLNVYPDQGFVEMRPYVRPHPLATKLQPLNYSEDIFKVKTKVYVYAEEYFGVPGMISPFEVIYRRLSQDAGWTTHSLPFGHDLLVAAPAEILEIIESTLAEIEH
jgi:pimeloyl-ACP methyl ester carboxylesterase